MTLLKTTYESNVLRKERRSLLESQYQAWTKSNKKSENQSNQENG